MENFGSEIGQKMRSAVKAKLLELGTGGSTGYIDDELPDYVMIMVANKRSKQQMIADLNLFLGSQTELFVTWLHEVLQKLQEVTLPAASATTKKRKTSQKEEIANKKDKKSNKKEKKTTKKMNEETTTATTTAAELGPLEKPTTTNAASASAISTVPVISSITDVFADVLLEKAKKSQDVTIDALASIKKGKGIKAAQEEAVSESPQTSKETTNEFNIPTISEISSTTGSGAATGENREKDLAELAEIQKKIYAAKKHLKKLGEINDENEDDDFLNLKDDGMESMDEEEIEPNDEENTQQAAANRKAKSPIVFDADNTTRDDAADEQDYEQVSKRRRLTPPPLSLAAVKSHSESQRRNENNFRGPQQEAPHPPRRSRERERSDRRELQSSESSKRPVHERLGMKPAQSRETQRERRVRQEKELYVPAFRRKEMENEREREMERQRDRDSGGGTAERDRGDRSRGRERERDRGDKARQRDTRHRRSSPPIPNPPLPHLNSQRSISSTRNSGASVEHLRHVSGGLMDVKVERNRSSSNDAERVAASSSQQTQRQRIGSRVIVAPVKKTEPSDEEEEKPVNSVIKIKPRPPVSPGKQACKNLLLRAVAEAQRSTIFAKKKTKESSITTTTTTTTTKKVSMRLGEIVNDDRKSKLYTKSFRDRLKRSTIATSSASSSSLFRRATQNLVIEVEGGKFAVRRERPRHADESHLVGAEEYVPESISEHGDSEAEYAYVPQTMGDESDGEAQSDVSANYEKQQVEDIENDVVDEENIRLRGKTQFVVTLNDEKAPLKYKKRSAANVRSRSGSPLPQVSSSSSASRYNGAEATSTTHPNSNNNNKKHISSRSHGGGGRSDLRSRHDIKSRLSMRPTSNASVSSPASTATATRSHERETSNSSPSTPPPPRRTEFIEIYRKPKEIKKIIIKADSEDEESPKKYSPENQRRHKRHSADVDAIAVKEERSTTPPLPPITATTKRRMLDEEKAASAVTSAHISTALKRKHTPIKFDFDKSSRERERAEDSDGRAAAKRRSKSGDRAERGVDRGGIGERDSSLERRNGDDRRKISIRNTEAKKYDNIPSLSSVALDSSSMKQLIKPKERCKYHPNCTKQFCDYYHPTAPCKAFPNCKFADKCVYSHPRCKYDMACTNIDCNFSHSGTRNSSLLQPTAPPLSSHVVPVQNYKSISATAPVSASGITMCKYYPGCTKAGCTFFHPKPCRFGKNCINKLECNFYHHELQSSSKFKWVASIV